MATASLIEDGGAAAAGAEFFRSPEFLAAEGVTHTLRIEAEGGALLAPLLVREIPGAERRDAISPYGYPGLGREGEPAPLDPDRIEFRATGLVSAFLRHALDPEPPLSGSAARNVVQIADPALPRKSRASDRNRINRNRRDGYRARIGVAAAAEGRDRDGFLAAYEQTMRRTGAAERYLFGREYFERLFASPRARLAFVDAPDGGIAAASLVVESDGFLHYYLSGTADEHLSASPMKNLLAALLDLGEELELPLNLGGGLSRGDALEEFKRGFANREQPWRVSELICDPDAYAELSGSRAKTDFFPAYRASQQAT